MEKVYLQTFAIVIISSCVLLTLKVKIVTLMQKLRKRLKLTHMRKTAVNPCLLGELRAHKDHNIEDEGFNGELGLS